MNIFRRHPIFVFFFLVVLVIAGLITFMQSPGFANWVKAVAGRYVSADVGIEGDFRDFSVKLFPPGISINQIKVVINKSKLTQLPMGAALSAERLDLIFLPLQILSGNILVNQVTVLNGEIHLPLTKNYLDALNATTTLGKKSRSIGLRWDELFKIKAESIGLENVRLYFTAPDHNLDASLLARQLSLGQWKGKGGVGYQLKMDLDSISGAKLGPLEKWLGKKEKLLSNLRVAATLKVNQLGANLDDFSVVYDGVELTGSGRVNGNVLTQKTLPAEVSLGLVTETQKLEKALRPFYQIEGKHELSGDISVDAKLKFDVFNPEKSLRANTEVRGKSLRVAGWATESLKFKGALSLETEDPLIEVEQFELESPQVSRKGGLQPGSGGKIQLGKTTFRLTKDPQTIELPLELSQVHLHWLTGPGTKKIYPLSLRATGSAGISLDLEGKDWSVEGKTKLQISELLLDNQRLGKNKAQRDVIRVKDTVSLESEFSVNDEAFELGVTSLRVSSKQGAVLTGTVSGDINFEKGYNLRSELRGNIGVLGSLAEVPIEGTGKLKIHAHGPGARTIIDFEPELEDATYLGLHLGSLAGMISLDEDPNLLLFKDVRLARGATRAVGNGVIDLGKELETLDIGIAIERATVEDANAIFSNLTHDIWWYPATMSGQWTGKARLSGGLSLDRLVIDVEGVGTGWEYWAERFSDVKFLAGYDRGRYQIQNFQGKKRAGLVNAQISFDGKDQLSWSLDTDQVKLSDLDHVARLEIPVKGALRLTSKGEGTIGKLKSITHAEMSDVVVRGTAYPASKVEIKSEQGLIHAEGYLLGAQASGKLTYSFLPGVQSELHIRANQLDFSPILLLLNSQLIQDPQLRGVLSGAADLIFKSGEIERASGQVAITEYELKKTGVGLSLKDVWKVLVKKGSFEAPRLSLVGDGGTANLDLVGLDSRLEGAVSGEIGIGLIEFFTPVLARARGMAQLNLGIGGTIKKPDVMGTVSIHNGNIFLPSIEAPLENIVGAINIKQSKITIPGIEGDLSKGKVKLGGAVELFSDRVPKLELSGSIQDSRIKVFPFQYAKVRGRFDVTGQSLPYLIGGRFLIESALLKEKMLNQAKTQGLKTARFTPPATTGQRGNEVFFRLNVDAIAEKGLIIQNDLFDAEAKATVKILNTLEAPRIVGKGDVIQGRFLFKDRAFQIQSASVEFDNPTTLNPKFNLLSSIDISGTKVQMYASGRMDSYKIELSSNPVLSEPDILSLLAIGVTKDDLKKLSGADRGLVEQGEGINLLLHSLDFNRDVQDKTGFQVEIDEAVNNRAGTNIFRPRADTDVTATAAPKIVIKRQIIKNKVDVSVGSTVGVGTGRQQQMNAEWKVTPGMSVIGVWDQVEMNDTTGTRRQSYGVDLKFQKRFK